MFEVYLGQPAHLTQAPVVSTILDALPAGRAEVSWAILIEPISHPPARSTFNTV